jgi:hypothetical protein
MHFMIEWNFSGTEVLLFDPSIDDCEQLLNGLDDNVKALEISHETFLSIFSECLSNPTIESIHILSHGKAGCLLVTNQQINSTNIINNLFKLIDPVDGLHKPLLRELNFWSCNVGQGDKGMKFINDLSKLTGAKVSASSTPIGHKNKGGNWELDVMAYPQVPFNKTAIENFEHTLNSDKPVIVLESEGVGTSYSETSASTSDPLFIAHQPVIYLTGPSANIKSGVVTVKSAAASDKLVLPNTSGGQIQATLVDASLTPISGNSTVMNSSTSSPVYFSIKSNENGNEVTTNLRVTLTGGNGADLVATFEGWDPSANSGAGGVASAIGTSSQFYSDLINSLEVGGLADGQTREVSVTVTDINNVTSDPSVATVGVNSSFVDSNITGFTPIINVSGEWIAEDQNCVTANAVGFVVNIDEAGNVTNDVTAALKAA